MVSTASAKALFIALVDSPAAAVCAINRLTPEFLCFFLPDSRKPIIESEVQPHITQMPKRWDWVLVPDPHSFPSSYQAVTPSFPELLQAWHIQPGELVVDFSDATPAMAAAMALVSRPFSSRVVQLGPTVEGEPITVGNQTRRWQEGNLWNEEALQVRREVADAFNQGAYRNAAQRFRRIESLISGGQKPFYHALADLADGYDAWEKFQYRPAWDKLKTALKAIELASVWGGPPGLPATLATVKANVRFLESVVLDASEVKLAVAHDLLAHAKRRAERDHDPEAAMPILLRALEAYAQHQLWKHYRIKTWDVRIDQLPQALREPCRTCFLDDVDGRYKLPLYAQFRALAGLGDRMGQTFLAEWAKMKPLLDAAQQGVLGHGFQPVKAERFSQLYTIVLKLANVHETILPVFPRLSL
ncbi:MAG: TIGR02710 family CRISPR-associated protein [Nitrospirae bacterium]|nr:MAG: TIGR02710 family CRISPR-associated protein [Nitrospirota bacterium]